MYAFLAPGLCHGGFVYISANGNRPIRRHRNKGRNIISAGIENLGGNMTTRQNSEKFDDEQRARVRAILERMGGNGTSARPLWENQDDWPPVFHAHCREERNEDPK